MGARAALRPLAAVLAAAALAGCITVYENDGEPDMRTLSGAGAYLLVPSEALEDPDNARAFYQVISPALTLEHPMTNAGSDEFPWYCFGFESMTEAEYGRRRVAEMPGGAAIAPYLLVDESCAAG